MMMLGLKSGPQIAAKTGIPAGLLFRRIWYSVWKSGVLGITEYRQGRPLLCDDYDTSFQPRPKKLVLDIFVDVLPALRFFVSSFIVGSVRLRVATLGKTDMCADSLKILIPEIYLFFFKP